MKQRKLIGYILLWIGLVGMFLGIFISSISSSEGYTVNDVIQIGAKDTLHNFHITDPNKVLNAADSDKLNRLCDSLYQYRGIKINVLILPAISEAYDSPFEFTHELRDYWVSKSKYNNTDIFVLLLTDRKQRNITFNVNSYLTERLSDDACLYIQRKLMIPVIRKGNYGQGLIIGVNEIIHFLDENPQSQASFKVYQETKALKEKLCITFLLIVFIIGLSYISYRIAISEVNNCEPSVSFYEKYLSWRRKADPASSLVFCYFLTCFWIIMCVIKREIIYEGILVAAFFIVSCTTYILVRATIFKNAFKKLVASTSCSHCHQYNCISLKNKESITTDSNTVHNKYTFICSYCQHTDIYKEKYRISYGYDSGGGFDGGGGGGGDGGGGGGDGGGSSSF